MTPSSDRSDLLAHAITAYPTAVWLCGQLLHYSGVGVDRLVKVLRRGGVSVRARRVYLFLPRRRRIEGSAEVASLARGSQRGRPISPMARATAAGLMGRRLTATAP